MKILGTLWRGIKRVVVGQNADERGGILHEIGKRIPNIITGNAKAWSGSATVVAYQEFITELGINLGSWETPLLVLVTLYAVWRTPNSVS